MTGRITTDKVIGGFADGPALLGVGTAGTLGVVGPNLRDSGQVLFRATSKQKNMRNHVMLSLSKYGSLFGRFTLRQAQGDRDSHVGQDPIGANLRLVFILCLFYVWAWIQLPVSRMMMTGFMY
ncbi:MAG: hypothetical protein DRP45_09905 [Candidatus Zixiibacteriota bacterium]|nr:MAG: hypothetical protein DRP45_09905 [candidate division Zixibacteria bacterium]